MYNGPAMKTINPLQSREVFEQTPNVVAAWIFGSAQQGQLGPDSDIDIGVLFAKTPTLDELLSLIGALQAVFHSDDVDLVTLNGASSILRFEAISGRLLFSRDEARRVAFVSLTSRQYEDDMAWIQRGFAYRREIGAQIQAGA